MIYLIAVPLIIGTTTLIGYTYSNRLQRRSITIRQIINGLQILESEIIFGRTPLQDAFYKISKQIPHPANLLFKETAELVQVHSDIRIALENALANLDHILPMEVEEKSVVLQLSTSLGKFDADSQQLHIRNAIINLERIHLEATDNFTKYGKMARYLGMLSGLLIVILLL